MSIAIRPIEKKDNLQLAQIIRAVFVEHAAPRVGTAYADASTDHLFELFETPNAALWVAEVEGEVMGCGGLFPTEGLGEDCLELVKFYLSPKGRGKGIGKMLLEKSIHLARSSGYKSIYIESLPHYATAVKMYEKAGFEYIPASLGNSGHTACNIFMLKKL